MPGSNNWASRVTGYRNGETDHSRPASHGETYRGPFERDVDRVKYTKFFRRLKNVTQVARAGEAYLYHDRLTHTLKVAQVGKRLSQSLLRRAAEEKIECQKSEIGLGDFSLPEKNPERSHLLTQDVVNKIVADDLSRQLDPEVVETACLAHDLGHPPFGHIAEDELDELLIENTHPAADNDLEWEHNWTLDSLPEPDPDEQGWSIDDLDAWARSANEDPAGLRFEGNAQSFRILTRLASHAGSNTGLGLTVASLAAVGKYPYGRGEWIKGDYGGYRQQDKPKSASGIRDSRSRGKFGFYRSERDTHELVRNEMSLASAPTLAADIMDYADDATYAVHDLVDFYKYDQIPLHRLLRQSHPAYSYDEPIEKENITENIEPLSGKLSVEDTLRFLASEAESVSISLFRPYEGTKEQQQALQAFSSMLIELLIDANDNTPNQLEVKKTGDKYRLVDTNGKFTGHIHTLQKLTEYYVITDTALAGQQRGQREILRELFYCLYDEAKGNELKNSAIPEPYVDWFEDPDVGGAEDTSRVVADVISSMTEKQALKLHNRLTGKSPGSLEDRIVR